MEFPDTHDHRKACPPLASEKSAAPRGKKSSFQPLKFKAQQAALGTRVLSLLEC
jgi:hypothetical protein